LVLVLNTNFYGILVFVLVFGIEYQIPSQISTFFRYPCMVSPQIHNSFTSNH
jgi:hypothetical protein